MDIRYILYKTNTLNMSEHTQTCIEHDSIAVRRMNAEKNLRVRGMFANMISLENLGPIKASLRGEFGLDGVAFIRLIRANVWTPAAQDELLRPVARLEYGGFRDVEDGIVDPVVGRIDYDVNGFNNSISHSLTATLGQLGLPDEVTTIYRGGTASRVLLDYEYLVALGRDKGMPVRDLYRPAHEDPVTMVRECPASLSLAA